MKTLSFILLEYLLFQKLIARTIGMMHGVMAWQKLVNVLVGMVLKMIVWKTAAAKVLYYLKMMGYVAVKCFYEIIE